MTQKIQTPNRVRYTLDKTVYCSSMIAREVRPLTMRIQNNILVPLRGRAIELELKLQELCRQYPEHFMRGSRYLLKTTSLRYYR